MILSKIENVKPEPKPINDPTADNLQVSPAIGNTNVIGGFVEALRQSVHGLLYRQYYDVNTGTLTEPLFKNCKSAIDALNKSIGLGGGHTLHPNVGNYWMVEYYPGIKITLVKSENNQIIKEKINRSLVIKIAEEVMNEMKPFVQLKLF